MMIIGVYRPNSACIIWCFLLDAENGFAELCMQSLNLLFVPFCKILVCNLTPDLATIKGNGFYNGLQYFEPDLNWDVQL